MMATAVKERHLTAVVVVLFLCTVVVARQAPSTQEKAAPEISLGDFVKLDLKTQGKKPDKLGERFEAVGNSILNRLSSPTDAKGQPKSPEILAAERKRAMLVKDVVLQYDTSEMSIRIQLALEANPKITLESVWRRYILDEVLKREEEAKKVAKECDRTHGRENGACPSGPSLLRW